MIIKRRDILLLIPAFLALGMHAEDKLAVSAIGRLHLDASIPCSKESTVGAGFVPGVGVTEVRAGAKATYGDWMSRIEIGYSYGKIGLKDVYTQRSLTNSYLRFGYFIPQFGIRGAGSASYKPSMQPLSSELFFRTLTRKVGVGYTYYDNECFVSGAAFAGGRSMTLNSTEQGKESFGFSARSVFHLLPERGERNNIWHAGVSAFYETASHTASPGDGGEEIVSPGFRNYSVNYPLSVCKVPMLKANVSDAKGDFKISPELVVGIGGVAFESQYFYMNVPRTDGRKAYQADGGSAMLRVLCPTTNGDNTYRYNTKEGALANPIPGSVEMVLGWDRVNANLGDSGIKGGKSSEYFIAGNWYINPYTVLRLKANVSSVEDSPVSNSKPVFGVQTRLQFVF